MAEVENPSQVMEAIEGFVTDINGERFIVQRGHTRVAASHPLVQHYPHHFQAVADNLTFKTEEAVDEPATPRLRSPSGKSTVLDQGEPVKTRSGKGEA